MVLNDTQEIMTIVENKTLHFCHVKDEFDSHISMEKFVFVYKSYLFQK